MWWYGLPYPWLTLDVHVYVCSFAGGPYSGAALNPARVLGPSMVFHCYWDTVPVYVTAELLGAFLAALLTMPLYGFGPHLSAGGQPTPDAEVTSCHTFQRPRVAASGYWNSGILAWE